MAIALQSKKAGLPFNKAQAAIQSEEDGIVLVSVALMLPVIIAVLALALEMGAMTLTRTQNQRIADLAAYAGAIAWGRTSSEDVMRETAFHVAELNGATLEQVTVGLRQSPVNSENQAVAVTVSDTQGLILAPIVGLGSSLTSNVSAVVELRRSLGLCVAALDQNGPGVSLSGGTRMSAPDCLVGSNTSLTLTGSGKLTARKVTYRTDYPFTSGSAAIFAPGDTDPDISQSTIEDPFADLPGVLLAREALADAIAINAPTPPQGSISPDVTFAYDPNKTNSALQQAGCTGNEASPYSNNWTVTCSSQTLNFGKIEVQGGGHVQFNMNGPASTTYNISSIKNSSQITFGPGTFNIRQGVESGGGTVLVLGSGNSNSYRIGPSPSTGLALKAEGSANVSFADALGDASVVELSGGVETAGSSCVFLPAAAEHYIKGSISTAGGLTLGSGLYAVTGYVALGEKGGGAVNCGGKTVGLDASNVTLAVDANQIAGGTCGGRAFCAANGYSGVTITAPNDGPTAGLAVIGPSGLNHAGAAILQGAADMRVSGVLYFPGGPIDITGGASIGGTGGAAGCLQLIGASVTQAGGTAAASECVDPAGTSMVARLVE
ncbi:MAG: Tad domain-containing protein [Mesorhizobium sp.]